MEQKFYSDKTTPAAIGDAVLYDSGLDNNVSRLVSFLPEGDSADAKLANGAAVIIGNCKRLATRQEVQ